MSCDVGMLRICVEEGLSNARKYGEPSCELILRASLEERGEVREESGEASALVTLHIELDNVNRAGVAPLSAEECLHVFEEGYKAHTSAAGSTGIGLHTTTKAISAASGKALLDVVHNERGGPHTVLHLFLPAERLPELSTPLGVATGDMGLAAIPTISAGMAGVSVAQAFISGTSADLPPSMSLDTEGLQPTQKLVCAALDDTFSFREIHRAMFEFCLDADLQRSFVLGETKEEQLAFKEVVLGLKNSSFELVSRPQPHADIVILDQNIDFQGEAHLLGSDIAGQLHEAGFCGVTCILTGSSLEVGLATLPFSCQSVHPCVGSCE